MAEQQPTSSSRHPSGRLSEHEQSSRQSRLFGDEETASTGEYEDPPVTSEKRSHTQSRRLIVIVAGLALSVFVVRAAIVGFAGAARTHNVVNWPLSTCTLEGGVASVIVEAEEGYAGEHLDWGRVHARVAAPGNRSLVAYDTVDGNFHGHISDARARFPARANLTSSDTAAADTVAINVPCALNPAFTDSCTLTSRCRRKQRPLGGACCSGRVVLGSSEAHLRQYAHEGHHARVYFALVIILGLATVLCHLCIFSAQARARALASRREENARLELL
jgi:hypothetical protein